MNPRDKRLFHVTNSYAHKATNESTITYTEIRKRLRPTKPWLPVRFGVALLGAMATAFVFALRVNLSVAIVAMVNNTAVSHEEARTRVSNDTDLSTDRCYPTHIYQAVIDPDFKPNSEQGTYVWSQSVQGLVLGAYYYGYATTQIMAGRLADRWGGRWLCGLGILFSSFATFLSPIAAETHVMLLLTARAFIGVAHGFVYTSLYSMFAVWFPKNERATALSMITVGGNIGGALTMPLAGYLSEYGFAGGWPSVFYSTGAASMVWFVVWMAFVRDRPEEHPFMSEHELNVIINGTDLVPKRNVSAPWKKIAKSPAVWAIAASKSCGMFGYYTLSTKLPAYLESVLRVPIQHNGYINAYTYVAVSITMCFAGPLSDKIRSKYNVSINIIRKVNETIALLGAALCLGLIPSAGCDQTTVTWLLMLSMFLFGFTTGGDIPIVSDLAPQFSGTLFGITNTVSCTMGFIAPIVVGLFLSDDHRSLHQWSKVFYFSATLSVLGNVIFCLWAKATPASWGTIQRKHKQKSYATMDHEKTFGARDASAKFDQSQIKQISGAFSFQNSVIAEEPASIEKEKSCS